ncbi:hypothetical protein [Halomonas rhizosphaerae]|uniref:Uncharacterized protein n=1 Tax=Halomonas rhizosphaerae TaxID=3043296 RepID=A0ABT6V211_9GAMM|nr:hypothetical protein [Halomonas rhizosphaerae]MDI5891845.1 hypothetical protein [Halomonas rhizosphaerae]
MEKNEITLAAVSIMSGAAAAMGPAGVPAFLLAASIGSILTLYGGAKEDKNGITEEIIKEVIRQHFAENTARTAWSKIKPSYHYYQNYVARASSGEEFSERDLSHIDDAIIAAIGPNSSLQEGLTLLYNEVKPYDYQYVEHNLPIYLLGASVHIQYRMLDIAKQKLNGETIVPHQWTSLADLADVYRSNVISISGYVKNMTIETILRKELAEGKFTLGSSKLEKRNEELHQHYLGNDHDVTKFILDMQQVQSRLKQTANL